MATLTAAAPVAAGEPEVPAKKKERVQTPQTTDDSGARYFLVKTSSTDKWNSPKKPPARVKRWLRLSRTGGELCRFGGVENKRRSVEAASRSSRRRRFAKKGSDAFRQHGLMT